MKTQQQLNAERLYAHAEASYPEKRGEERWDFIVECFTTDEIIAEFFPTPDTTYEQGLASARKYVKTVGDHDAEMRAMAEW